MQGDGRHGMHVGFGNVLDHDGYIVVPRPDGFIVRGSDKAAVFVDKGDRVDGSQVLVVFLGDVARIHVVLVGTGQLPLRGGDKAYLNDLLVGHASEKDVLLVIIGVEADDVGGLAVAESLETLTGLGVPQLDLTIVATGQELGAVV